MMPIFASAVLAAAALVQPDPASMLRPSMPRQAQNASPGPIADLPAGVAEPTVFAEFGARRVTGIATSRLGRVFVCAAPTGQAGDWLVAERGADGSLQPFPPADGANPLVLTSVTSIQVDAQERVWILDSANPDAKGVVRTGGAGPKLVCVDLATNKVVGKWEFDETIAPASSMLADVRLQSNDRRRMLRDAQGKEAGVEPQIMRGDLNFAYITDAGGGDAGGAIIYVTLNSGKARRLLAGHASTKAEAGFTPAGSAAGKPAALNADAIALDSINEILYWQPLGSRTLYSVRTAFVRDEGMAAAELAKRVNTLGPTVMASSMQLDAGGTLYFSDVENDRVVSRTPEGKLAAFARLPAGSAADGLVFARDPVSKRGVMWLPAPGAAAGASAGPFKVYQLIPGLR